MRSADEVRQRLWPTEPERLVTGFFALVGAGSDEEPTPGPGDMNARIRAAAGIGAGGDTNREEER